jgi:DNA primase
MEYLFSRGLSRATIEHFSLGLTKPYQDKNGTISSNCLIYPLFNRHGQPVKKNAYYNIPGVSENPRDPNGWMAGDVMCYYAADAESRKSIFVCEGAKDLWRLWQELRGTELDRELLLVTSTHGSAFPGEWQDPDYWSPWDRVYFGQDNDSAGERIVSKLVEQVGRDALRVRVPASMGKDWTDYFQNGGTFESFNKLIDEATPVTRIITDEEEGQEQFGLLAYQPVDINGSFHKGHLYYTVQALMRERIEIKNEEGGTEEQVQEAVKTVVVRSDGAILSAVMPPAPKGTPPAQRVLRLRRHPRLENACSQSVRHLELAIDQEVPPCQKGTGETKHPTAFCSGERYQRLSAQPGLATPHG